MTQETIQKKIEAIQKITNAALQTKESARKILVDAGIIKKEPESKEENPKKK